MIAIHINRVRNIQKGFEAQIRDHQTRALHNLRAINKNLFSQQEKDYLIDVISVFEQIDFLIENPKRIIHFKRLVGSLPANSRVYRNGRPKKQLKHYIQEALNYKGLRNTFYPTYFQKIGIKACVYCNSQLTVTTSKSGGSYKAKFDIDHYESKDEYPFLSISLFNLYPSCSSCNRTKGNRRVKFELYTDEINKTIKSSYSFLLDSHAKSKYLTSKDSSILSFKFIETPPDIGFKSLQEAFHIEELYETQRDIIEELIIKSQIYNEEYKRLLRSCFSKLSLNAKLFERILVGNYVEDIEIHKRPMAKFTMDIARQLKLIK